MTKAIYFDMDGTIADLYSVENWLPMLQAHNPAPYEQAKVMVNMSYLARLLNSLQKQGYKIGVVSWRSKCSTPLYDIETTWAKLQWLGKHLPSVTFDEIVIADYGQPKSTLVRYPQGILFDDEINNICEWKGKAYTPDYIFKILKTLLKAE